MGASVTFAEVQVIAHRGASHARPENTVEAFRHAAALGSDAAELDVRRTRDGSLVVHHNPHLHDLRLIADTLVADLPASVATLQQALDACAGMWVNVEIKNDENEPDFDPTDSIADQTMAELIQRDEHDRWVISSFRIETVDRCRAIADAASLPIRTAWLTSVVPEGAAAMLVQRGHIALHPWVGLLSRDVIDDCHAHGLQVNTWTCDDPDRMRQLVEWGIDGICTNDPDVALDILGRT